jgi:uncharacterized membrane protein
MDAPAATSGNRTVMIVLSYLWILALVPLLVEKTDQEVQWHARHGIVLLVAEIIFWIGYSIVSGIAGMIFFPLAITLGALGSLFWLAIVIIHIIAIVRGINGERLIIPGVSEYAARLA